jgi:hypothetical protein
MQCGIALQAKQWIPYHSFQGMQTFAVVLRIFKNNRRMSVADRDFIRFGHTASHKIYLNQEYQKKIVFCRYV